MHDENLGIVNGEDQDKVQDKDNKFDDNDGGNKENTSEVEKEEEVKNAEDNTVVDEVAWEKGKEMRREELIKGNL